MEQKDPKEVHKCDFYLLFVDPTKPTAATGRQRSIKYLAF